jgi:EAL domain-containing protein (putative c-di-GMP-specific phosphodiesterase class I)
VTDVEAVLDEAVARSDPGRGDSAIQRTLRIVREHLGLEVAFVSQFVEGRRVFRFVDADDGLSDVRVGGSDPLEESYCHYVVGGSLPEFLPDPSRHPVAARLPVTAALPVGTHMSVPIRFSDGRVYGTLCCFDRRVHPGIEARDITALHMIADLTAEHLEALDAEERSIEMRRRQILDLLDDPEGIIMVFQPLVDLRTGRVDGLEALARFPTLGLGPEVMFAEAWAVGLGVELELKAVRAALAVLDDLPHDMLLGVNVAPRTLTSTEFFDVVCSVPPNRLAVEVTEHDAVDDYDALRRTRQRLAALGIVLAIDDVGMGFSGLNHILESTPDAIKIDAAVVRDLHNSPAKEAMIEALVAFGARVGMVVIAEGIETAAELDALRRLGVGIGQGFHLARPDRLDIALNLVWSPPA